MQRAASDWVAIDAQELIAEKLHSPELSCQQREADFALGRWATMSLVTLNHKRLCLYECWR